MREKNGRALPQLNWQNGTKNGQYGLREWMGPRWREPTTGAKGYGSRGRLDERLAGHLVGEVWLPQT